MDESNATRTPMIVVDKNGLQGVVAERERVSSTFAGPLLVHFENGQEVFVPSNALIRHEDGRFYLPVSVEVLLASQESNGHNDVGENATATLAREMTDDQTIVVPVIEEVVKVQTQTHVSGAVEIRKTIHERTETIDQLLHSEEVEVERVAVNRFVEAPIPVRHEGDTMIISLLEEVLVVEKRLLLREEVHVKTVRKEMHNPQEVLLREERVDVVHKPGAGQGNR